MDSVVVPEVCYFFVSLYYRVISEDGEDYQSKYESLLSAVGPFKEQLEAYEAEKTALEDQNKATVENLKQLAVQHGKVLGHQNHKQKINHLVKLKTDNVNLQQENARLLTETRRQAKAIARLEAKVHGGDKENVGGGPFARMGSKSVASTPAVQSSSVATAAASSKEPRRQATLKGSPLASRNRLFH